MNMVGRIIASAVAFILGPSLISPATADETKKMRFSSECLASFCYLIAEGRVDATASERFENFVKDVDSTYEILLDSQGGKLEAGIKLGRAIRSKGLGTIVGRWKNEPPFVGGKGVACLSACAYAFLGGVTRKVPVGNRIGFHQFSLPGGRGLQGKVVFSAAQHLAATMLSYIVEMNIDPRLFARASSKAGDDMFYPSVAQLDEYDVITPQGFDHLVLEPYGGGIIATSKRLDATSFRDLATKLIAYCHDGKKTLLLVSEQTNGISAGMEFLDAGVSFGGSDIPPILVSGNRISTWATGTDGYVKFTLTSDNAELLYRAKEIEVFFQATGAAGGRYRAVMKVNDMDQKMLASAFRFCIEDG